MPSRTRSCPPGCISAPFAIPTDSTPGSIACSSTPAIRRHGGSSVARSWRSTSKIPILIDWNLGNFSVETLGDGRFRLYSRWDYDWFRIEPRLLDFYFLSRVSSSTGDRTRFTYGPHTLVEPSFLAFLDAYRSVFPMSDDEVAFLPEVYRFFILNYVVREGARFFRRDLCTQFRRDAVRTHLPALDVLDTSPLLKH